MELLFLRSEATKDSEEILHCVQDDGGVVILEERSDEGSGRDSSLRLGWAKLGVSQ